VSHIHFRCDEGETLFVGPAERYVVAKLVGYATDGARTAREAAQYALVLAPRAGFPEAHWLVYDRVTTTTHLFKQTDFALQEVDAA
jgi:hypothetical protein